MATLTLSAPIKELLEKIGGEPESRALNLLISGVKEHLKSCELEILEYETNYGFPFETFKERLIAGKLGDEFSYDLEKDAMKWEDLLLEKKKWIKLFKNIESLQK